MSFKIKQRKPKQPVSTLVASTEQLQCLSLCTTQPDPCFTPILSLSLSLSLSISLAFLLNSPYKFIPPSSLALSHFGLTPFGWLRFIVLTSYCSWEYFWFVPVWFTVRRGSAIVACLGCGFESRRGMDVCLFWVLCGLRWGSLRWADHSTREVLPSKVCLTVIVQSWQRGGRGPVGAAEP
jgi:hypothetical protein